MNENEIGKAIIGHAIKVHKELGPGLLESVYEIALEWILKESNLHVRRQICYPVIFRGQQFSDTFRIDLLVENKVILKLKSVENLHPAHLKQVLTYLKMTNLKLGYVLNFGERVMHRGVHRVINGRLE